MNRSRVLIISFFFPPYNSIGAVRLGKMAKYLCKMGYDIRVVSAKEQLETTQVALEVPPELVSYTPWSDRRWPLRTASQLMASLRGRPPAGSQQGVLAESGNAKAFYRLYRTVFCYPDIQAGWYAYALRAVSELSRTWHADVIYASGAPYVGLMVAQAAARKLMVPWVAELRDLWVDNHYYEYPAVRRYFEERLERRTLSSASQIVTVSEPLRETLSLKYKVPVHVVTNGYDPDDLPREPRSQDYPHLSIVHTGILYDGKRDPTPLFDALSFQSFTPDKVRISFYGYEKDAAVVRRAARRANVEPLVEFKGLVSHKESIAIQCSADVLLLILCNDPREKGVFTGKFFEYWGTGRPILAIGPEDNVAAREIIRAGRGIVSVDPVEIGHAIRDWCTTKTEKGRIDRAGDDDHSMFTRESQAKVMAKILDEAIAANWKAT